VRGGSDTVSWYAGAFYYLYPGGADVSYAEIIASAEATVGLVTFGAQVAYAPPQDNLGSGNKYLAASAAFDTGSGFGLLARGGYEDGWFFDRKWDWELGANYTRGPFTASLSYVDTDYDAADEEGRLARAGLVASLLAEF
jgi:uncharacterized protein (TIGR02001 family)